MPVALLFRYIEVRTSVVKCVYKLLVYINMYVEEIVLHRWIKFKGGDYI